MLIGEYYHNIDAKGRVIIPAKFREDLGDNFVVSKGLDGCIYVYSTIQWQEFQDELLSQRNSDARKLHRFFFSGATAVETDAQGRILIPPTFREYAALTKDVVILGVSNRAEIWDKSKWETYMSDPSFSTEEIAKAMERLGY